MESNPKEIRLGTEKIDRISELPDSILSVILSYLPTKNAVGTLILSTRWKNFVACGFMPNKLSLDDSSLINPREDNFSSFTDFVDRLLNETLSGAHSVAEIIVKCDKRYGEDKVVSWVSAAVRLNVQHLDIKFAYDESMAFFRSLNGCTTLVTLRLCVESCLLLPDYFCLPNLKILVLDELYVDDEEDETIRRLMEGCPALEYLYFFHCNLSYMNDACIKNHVLKKLVIESFEQESLSNIILDTPNLEVLVYNGFLTRQYLICNFNSLCTAHIDIRPSQLDFSNEGNNEDIWHFDNSTTKIVSRCSSTIRLYLSDYAIDALHRSSIQLPIFHNLLWLSLGCLHWSILAHLLQMAPNLEHLIIREGFQGNEEGFGKFKNLLPIPPKGLVSHVKTIEFWIFEGVEDEIRLVEYLLRNGEVLQNLVLHPCDMSILTRLSTLPRKSKKCQIECKGKQEMSV